MKKFLDTLAVFVGNLLDLNPKSWLESQRQAQKMREAARAWEAVPAPSIVHKDGQEEVAAAPESPFSYLGRTALVALGFVGLAWVVTQVVTAFIYVLPILAGLAVLALLMTMFGPKKPDPIPA
jgi:hypothetical protein